MTERRHRDPLHSLPTALIQLSPNFLAQLKKIAPQKKRSKLFYVALFAIPAIVTFVALHPPSRAFVVNKARSAIARIHGQPAAAPIVAAEPMPTVTPSAAPALSVAPSVESAPSASVAPSASIATPKSKVKRPASRK